MRTRGALMVEHRLIERMIAAIGKLIARAEAEEKIDPVLVDVVGDFLVTYADHTHHGKEEGILFKALAGKSMSVRDREIMRELSVDHTFGRDVTSQLIDANDRYRQGDASALPVVTGALRTLRDFYPKHIAREDVDFFLAYRSYLTEEEEQAMVQEFCDFDRKMIHEKYRSICDELDRQQGTDGAKS